MTPFSVSLLGSELLDIRSMPNTAHGTEKVGQQSCGYRIFHTILKYTNNTEKLSFEVQE